MKSNYRELIKKAIEDFHKDYYPEVIVSFIGENEKGDLAFLFEGHFCITCGMHDYFIDFSIRLEKILGEKFIVSDKYGLNEGYDGWIVIYSRNVEGRGKEESKFFILDPRSGKIVKKIKINQVE